MLGWMCKNIFVFAQSISGIESRIKKENPEPHLLLF